MSVLASDNFQRADGALGANWTTMSGRQALKITSNTVTDSSSTSDADAVYTAISFPNDQYSAVTIAAFGAGGSTGAGCRMTSGATNLYIWQASGTDRSMFKAVSGSFTQIDRSTSPPLAAVGDVWQLNVQGTSLTGFKNGSQVATFTDSSLTSGSAGIGADHGGSSVSAWSAGDFSTLYVAPVISASNYLPAWR